MKITRRLLAVWAMLLVLFVQVASAGHGSSDRHGQEYLVYVGTYTDGTGSKGIYAYRYHLQTGELTPLGVAAESSNPSFLAVHPARPWLYAVNELVQFEGKSSGAVSAYRIDPANGGLTLLNQVASLGADPCYVSIDKTGKYVLIANYTGGSVSTFPLLDDGRLGRASAFVQHEGSGVDRERQEGPHAHSIDLSADNRYAITADLGTDKLMVYRFDPRTGSLSPNATGSVKVNPGAGPRHFAFHPSGRFAYALNELTSTITVFSYTPANGHLHIRQNVAMLPADFHGRNDAAEIQVHPSGTFLYASNRGHESIAVFAIDRKEGTLRLVERVPSGGKEPRFFTIDPSGERLFAANQNSGNIVIFKIDQKTGHLQPTGQVLAVPSPVAISFAPVEGLQEPRTNKPATGHKEKL
jgi:6-phosphogluconolactonase